MKVIHRRTFLSCLASAVAGLAFWRSSKPGGPRIANHWGITRYSKTDRLDYGGYTVESCVVVEPFGAEGVVEEGVALAQKIVDRDVSGMRMLIRDYRFDKRRIEMRIVAQPRSPCRLSLPTGEPKPS